MKIITRFTVNISLVFKGNLTCLFMGGIWSNHLDLHLIEWGTQIWNLPWLIHMLESIQTVCETWAYTMLLYMGEHVRTMRHWPIGWYMDEIVLFMRPWPIGCYMGESVLFMRRPIGCYMGESVLFMRWPIGCYMGESPIYETLAYRVLHGWTCQDYLWVVGL